MKSFKKGVVMKELIQKLIKVTSLIRPGFAITNTTGIVIHQIIKEHPLMSFIGFFKII